MANLVFVKIAKKVKSLLHIMYIYTIYKDPVKINVFGQCRSQTQR